MKSCKNCGAELSDEAAVCRECGEAQPLKAASDDSFFSMPYLSAQTEGSPGKKLPDSEKQSDTPDDSNDKNDKTKKIIIDQITDPRERAFAKQDRRNKMIRIAALIVVGVLIIAGGIFLLTRNTGYHRTLDKYIDGRTNSGGTAYLSIVPELYLINAESLYSMSRPDIRSNTSNYLKYVKNQYESDYGSGLSFTYKIVSERTVDDEASLDTIEDTILSAYSTEVNISEAAYVSIRITTKGSVTQSTETMSMTFFKYDGKWYSMDAMKVIQFACENSGYQLW